MSSLFYRDSSESWKILNPKNDKIQLKIEFYNC